MKKNLLFSLILFSGVGLIAQEIDISKFVVPEYLRYELEFNINNSNSGSLSNTKMNATPLFQNSQSLNTSSSTDIKFRRYANSNHYQGYVTVDLNLDFPDFRKNWGDNTTSDSESSTKQSSLNFNFRSGNRFYFDAKYYLEFNPDVRILYTASYADRIAHFVDTVSNNGSKSESTSLTYSLASDFRFGKGRVENVEDLRQVEYILKDLQKAGRLKREITQEESVQLAEKLNLIKNRRFLDSRLRLIDEMVEIEKVMTEMDLISDNDAAYFSTVYDYWSMTANPVRSSGTRTSFGVRPSFYATDDKSTYDLIRFNPDTIYSDEWRVQRNGYSILISALYENYEPIDLYWQQDYSAELFVDFQNFNNGLIQTEVHTSYDMVVFGATGNYSLKYYPNSRTSYSGNAGITYQNAIGKEEFFVSPSYQETKDDGKYSYFRTNVGLSAERYFSPQLTITGSVGLSYMNLYSTTFVYNNSNYAKNNEIGMYLNFGLVYKMF